MNNGVEIFSPLRPGAPPGALRELIGDMSNIRTVLELGNKTRKRNGPPYRNWYVDQGCKYVSIDWNGKDGALPLDLQKRIRIRRIGGPFDLVTNFGTTEHVSEQEPCWENVHRAIKVGGKFINHTPYPGYHDNHGSWQPDFKWFEEFASLNGYEIELQELSKSSTWHFAHLRMRKVDNLSFTFPTTKIYNTSKK